MNGSNQLYKGETISFTIKGNETYNFLAMEKTKFKLLVYPNGLDFNLEQNKDKVKKIDSSFLETLDKPQGGWVDGNKDSNGYVIIDTSYGQYGKAVCVLPYQETKKNMVASPYTIELVWSSDDDKFRTILRANSAFVLVESIGEHIDSNYDL